MFDFLTVKKNFVAKQQRYEYYPAFIAKSRIKDLMVRSKDFYAIINPETGFWVKDEGVAIELMDRQVYEYVTKEVGEQLMQDPEHGPIIKRISDTDNHLIDKWHKFCQKDIRDSYETLNQKIIFSNTEVTLKDYSTYKLDYPLQEEPTPFYDKLVNTLYLPEEREKFEWMVGCILAGEQNKIQKLFVFYGLPGSGKSTIINKVIVNTIFGGTKSPYCRKFTAGLLAQRDSFGTGFLSEDPVLAFDDDADLSRIEDNTTLNIIVSHEAVRVNEKFRAPFITYPNCLLVCGTNEPVQLSPNSGLNRRLIDIRQTGDRLSPDEYDECIDHLVFEKSGIAHHCLQVYKSLGKNHYNRYVPEDMLSMTSPFHNYVKDNYFELKDGITLANAYKLYCDYAEESNYKTIITRYKFRDNLKLYFDSYEESFFSGFKGERIGLKQIESEPIGKTSNWLSFDKESSLFDELYSNQPAQYANDDGNPKYKWENVKTKLKDLNTRRLHYVRVPIVHVVCDFDKKDSSGKKSLELNIEAASKFPPTYAELSKSGCGIHLHYIYTGGDPGELSRLYGDNIEVKVFVGNAALRRKLTKCNGLPIAEISSGLPLKEENKKMVDWDGFKNEKILRSMIIKNINREYHANTKPSIDYIDKLLSDAYRSGVSYDVRDLEQAVLGFALQSTNNSQYCVNLVSNMHFCSDNFIENNQTTSEYDKAPIVIYDIESYPGDEKNEALLLVCWAYWETIKDKIKNVDSWLGFKELYKHVVKMYNPAPEQIVELFKNRLVGFNNRKYDNHMIYARSQGYTAAECNKLSRKIIDGKTGFFREAYNLSYTDILDFASASNKMGLKKWEIKLGIHHKEMNHPWDQPLPKDRWEEAGEYCANDVLATAFVFDYLKGDFLAREILSELSGLTVNDTTNQHTTEILTKGIKDPQKNYIYTDLSTIFPGYEFNEYGIDKSRYNEGVKIVSGKSIYHGIDPGEGGRKIGYPGMYYRVGLFDVESMHPSSAIHLDIFGKEITKRLKVLKDTRLAIKHGDYEKAKKLILKLPGGENVIKYLSGPEEELKANAKALSNALKTAINSVYGLTSASFDNKLRDPRNKDNIVAKYGALFMINLEEEIKARGYEVVHVSTDSIKIANVDDKIAKFVMDYGKKYGFKFEYEALYSKMCLINDAVYIAEVVKEDEKDVEPYWTATGKQFAVPYVFKTLFSHEPIIFEDLCETFNVKEGSIYLDFNEDLPDPTEDEKLLKKMKKDSDVKTEDLLNLEKKIAKSHNYQFVGNVGQFTPIIRGEGGGVLVRIKDGKPYAVQGTKGYRWLESESIKALNKEVKVDRSYYRKLVDDAVAVLSEFGDVDQFIGEVKVPYDFSQDMNPPTLMDYVNDVSEKVM